MRLFFTNYKVVPLGFFQILTKNQTEPFSGLTFLCFFGKKRYIFEFTLLHHVLSEFIKKPIFSESASTIAEV